MGGPGRPARAAPRRGGHRRDRAAPRRVRLPARRRVAARRPRPRPARAADASASRTWHARRSCPANPCGSSDRAPGRDAAAHRHRARARRRGCASRRPARAGWRSALAGVVAASPAPAEELAAGLAALRRGDTVAAAALLAGHGPGSRRPATTCSPATRPGATPPAPPCGSPRGRCSPLGLAYLRCAERGELPDAGRARRCARSAPATPRPPRRSARALSPAGARARALRSSGASRRRPAHERDRTQLHRAPVPRRQRPGGRDARAGGAPAPPQLAAAVYRRTEFVVAVRGDDARARAARARGRRRDPRAGARRARARRPARRRVHRGRRPSTPATRASWRGPPLASGRDARVYVVEGRFQHVNFIVAPAPLRDPRRGGRPAASAEAARDGPQRCSTSTRTCRRSSSTSCRSTCASSPPRTRPSTTCSRAAAPASTSARRSTSSTPGRRTRRDWTLVGCERSRQIHVALYGHEPPTRVDFCPLVVEDGADDELDAAQVLPARARDRAARPAADGPVGREPRGGPRRRCDGWPASDVSRRLGVYGTCGARTRRARCSTTRAARALAGDHRRARRARRPSSGIIPAARRRADRRRPQAGSTSTPSARRRARSGHSTLGLIRVLRDAARAGGRRVGLPRRDRPGRDRHVVRARDAADARDRAARPRRRSRTRCSRSPPRTATRVMLGRTHGQPGLPITFGFKAAVWAAEVRRHLERIDQAEPRLAVGQLAGAVGTQSAGAITARSCSAACWRASASACRTSSWMTARDRVAEFVTLLALITGDAREDRQRGLQPPARRDRRALGGADGRRRRQHHDAAEAQSRALRAPLDARPRRPRRRRARARGPRRRARARRGGVEDRVGVRPAACGAAAAALALGRELVAGLQVHARSHAGEPRRAGRLRARRAGDARARRAASGGTAPTSSSTAPRWPARSAASRSPRRWRPTPRSPGTSRPTRSPSCCARSARSAPPARLVDERARGRMTGEPPEGYLGATARIRRGPAPELVAAGYELELADAPLLARGLGLADLAHVRRARRRSRPRTRPRCGARCSSCCETPPDVDPRYGDLVNARERLLEQRAGARGGLAERGPPAPRGRPHRVPDRPARPAARPRRRARPLRGGARRRRRARARHADAGLHVPAGRAADDRGPLAALVRLSGAARPGAARDRPRLGQPQPGRRRRRQRLALRGRPAAARRTCSASTRRSRTRATRCGRPTA